LCDIYFSQEGHVVYADVTMRWSNFSPKSCFLILSFINS